MRINITTIPHADQRYNTCGDYWTDGTGVLEIRVSYLGDQRLERLVALHELVEWTLCEHAGIAEPDIKAFDEAHPESDDPGALADAPYRMQHLFAEAVERAVAIELGVDWNEYGTRIEALVA